MVIAMLPRRKFLRAAALAIVCMPWCALSLEAAPIPVRFMEGVSLGFLAVRSQDDKKLADGEVLQVAKDDAVESRLVLHFADGSLYDETAVFSQQRVFTLQRYHLVQRGPSFPTLLDISFDRKTGRYSGRYSSGKGGDKALNGPLEMPPDVYNGMTGMLVRNLPRGASETVQMVAFTPKPRLVRLHLLPFGDDSVLVGDVPKQAVHYEVVPEIGGFLGFFSSLIGKKLPTLHYWITRDEIPAFLAYEGPLFADGPVWRVGSSYRTEPPKWVPKKK